MDFRIARLFVFRGYTPNEVNPRKFPTPVFSPKVSLLSEAPVSLLLGVLRTETSLERPSAGSGDSGLGTFPVHPLRAEQPTIRVNLHFNSDKPIVEFPILSQHHSESQMTQ